MSTELISFDFSERFNEIIESTENDIRIISPFIGYKTALRLADFLNNNKKVKCKIITRFYREDFIQQVSSIEGLKKLLEAGAEILALVRLHTKLYIFDNSSVIIGSANFTTGGFYTNHELSVLIDGEEVVINESISHFNELWEKIKENGNGEISNNWIEEEIKQVNKITKNRDKNSKNINSIKRGAVLSIEPGDKNNDIHIIRKNDLIEESLSKDSIEGNSNAWLKFIGKSTQRISGDSYYNSNWKDKDKKRIYFNRNPLSIKEEAIVYEVALSYDKNSKPTPMILGRAIVYGYKKENKITKEEEINEPWKREYPYYLEVKEAKYIKATIEETLPLDDLYNALGVRVYPSTALDPNAKREDINLSHRQKSHLRITEMAKEYLDKEIELYFEKYGEVII